MNKIMKLIILIILIVAVTSVLSGCLPGDGTNTATAKAGFFWGIWHGWTAPISLIVGLFDKNIRVYETNNVGWFYDFGYYIAVISGFGGIALSRRTRREKVVVRE